MITSTPDKELDLAILENELRGIESHLIADRSYFFREKAVYVPSGDSYYMIHVHEEIKQQRDDLLGEWLFSTEDPARKIKHLCRYPFSEDYAYWKSIPGVDVSTRLQRFLTMYRENYLQFPCSHDLRIAKKNQAPKLKRYKYLFEIHSPWKKLCGYAGSVIVELAVSVHPCASVMVTVCVPAGRLPLVAALPPPFHA